jgi:Cu-processing system ATP-binding protein
VIRLESVSKRFGPIEALAPLDLEIQEGEWLGVFGRNGSGKTSLLRILVGLSRPTTGRVLIAGREPTSEDWRRFRRRLGFMPERLSLFENLTGEKTLGYFARLKGVDGSVIPRLLERVGLSHAGQRKLGGYSKGMLQRVNFAQALLGDPDVLVVDEPIEGLDAHGVKEFFEILKSVEGRTVVFSSHRLPLLSRFVDRICVLSQGKLKALGTEDELHDRLNLPVRVIIHPSPESNGDLKDALARLGTASIASQQGKLVASVSQRDKIRFLAALDGLAGSIQDVRIEEPSLEEVLLETS